MTLDQNEQETIIRTERGLTIAGTRITLYDVMDYIKAEYPHKYIRDAFMLTDEQINVQDIDHLGIIVGIVDEIGIVEIINDLLGTHPQEQVSAGHVVKALILNCLGFG